MSHEINGAGMPDAWARLWAPHRLEYLRGENRPLQDNDIECPFCAIPLHAAEHFYIVTEAVEGISPTMPVLRDQDGCGYFKEDAGKLLVGWFEPVAKPWGMKGISEEFSFTSLPEDFEHIAPLVENATHRMPLLAQTGIRLFFNGPESFTPDDRYLPGKPRTS